MTIARITGTITLTDGTTSEFSIDPDVGWQQWGARDTRLIATTGILDTIVEAIGDQLSDADEYTP